MGQSTDFMQTIQGISTSPRHTLWVIPIIIIAGYMFYNAMVLVWNTKKLDRLESLKNRLYRAKRMREEDLEYSEPDVEGEPIMQTVRKITPKEEVEHKPAQITRRKLAKTAVSTQEADDKAIEKAMQDIDIFHKSGRLL